MPELLTKLRPDRDLQCYFLEPSAIAALSDTSPTGFTLSGCWRQQFDWAVIEWNRDNVIDHPALRNLPDGDLSGIRLSYEETRTNCIPIDAAYFDAIGWSYLRVWEYSGGQEQIHFVPLLNHATPIEGTYTPATLHLELKGTLTAGDYVELSWLDKHVNYMVHDGDSLETVIANLTASINALGESGGIAAAANGTQILLTCLAAKGVNGNRIGVYGGVHGSGTEYWSPAWGYFSGGASPTKWQINLDFSNLVNTNNQLITTTNIRKLRWTWSADFQQSHFQRTEFAVQVTNWQVSGSRLTYQVAGPGSRRIEDHSPLVSYTGSWSSELGNYSHGTIRHTTTPGSALTCTYSASTTHFLFLGTRYTSNGGLIEVTVDSGTPLLIDLKRGQEDVLIRVPLGQFDGAANHTVSLKHCGTPGSDVYFDFIEIALPTPLLPSFPAYSTTTLATDWDTYHSRAIAPERTAWEIATLGFLGRANHYAGAMWFYELCCPGNQYASASITFSGSPSFGASTSLVVAGTTIQRLNLITDTAESIAKCFEFLITAGSSAVWAQADGPTLTITARAMGAEGNAVTVSVVTNSEGFTATVTGPALAGGIDGRWTTDLTAMPRLNRAARDWTRSYFRSLKAYGIDAAAAFSMELRHGDDSLSAGIAQRYPQGPVWLNTPALQTNFGPASLAFWQQVYLDMATLMSEAGMRPYLQFGEVQWWYFADSSGMPFYDEYTVNQFQTIYERTMSIIPSQNANPADYPEECAFLPTLIGQFTNAIIAFVRQTYANACFEALYPVDTNDTPLNRLINYPAGSWQATTLACLKTENFTYTGNRDLNKVRKSIDFPSEHGFLPARRSHLIGIGDYTSPWRKEHELAIAAGMESVVFFALDQFCLIGYELPISQKRNRIAFMGA